MIILSIIIGIIILRGNKLLKPHAIGFQNNKNNFNTYVLNDPVNFVDPLGLNRRGRRAPNSRGNPYAAMQYRSLMRQMAKYQPGYAEIRSPNSPRTWKDVNRLQDQVWNARQKAAESKCPNRIGGVPNNWIDRPSNSGGGIRFTDPNNSHNSVRVMPGDPNSPYPNSQVPYVRWIRNGQSLDGNGNAVPRNSPDAHIPINNFQFR